MSAEASRDGNTPMVLDIGCGDDKVDGSVGIDVKETDAADIVLDVNSESLPYDDGTIEQIHARMSLEHMDAPSVIAECHRVLEPGGTLHIKLPHPFTSGFWQDWTHVIQPGFTRKGIEYLDAEHPMNYEHDIGSWDVEEVQINFWFNFESVPGRAFSAATSKLLSLASDRTREEMLKLPFAGGWTTATLRKRK